MTPYRNKNHSNYIRFAKETMRNPPITFIALITLVYSPNLAHSQSITRRPPPRFNTFTLQSHQAGSTTDIDNLRVIDLDTGLVVYSNDFSEPSLATKGLNLYYFPTGGLETDNFVTNGPMTRVVSGSLRLETTGFGANGNGGYNSHSEAEYTQPLPNNFLVEFDAVRLQWAGHFHFHVSYRDMSDPPCSHGPMGAYTPNRVAPYSLNWLRMAASGSWFQDYGLNTEGLSTESTWPIRFTAPAGTLGQTHRLGIGLSGNIASFYLDGQLLNSADISEYIGTPIARAYVEAPVTIDVTVTSSLEPVYTASGTTVSTATTKITNRELLDECISKGLITSPAGWSLVVYYDSIMKGPYTGSDPLFRLRHSDGRLVPVDSIISIQSIAVSGGGKATVSKGKLSGSLSRRGLYSITIKYGTHTGIFYGPMPSILKLSGTPDEYYGIANATTASLNGHIDGDYDSTAVISLKVGAFKRK